MNLAGSTERLKGKPTNTVGSVGLDEDFITTFEPKHNGHAGLNSIEQLLSPLEKNEFDVVAAGRGLIANPDWAIKVKGGRFSNLIP